AEAKVLGFSGYLCELLVLKYGSFRGVLENSLSWRPTTVLELDRPPARTFTEPLVVVDPVDPNRNVASAVGVEQMATFVHAARAYLQAPHERFFFPRPLKPLPLPKLRALVRQRGAGLLAISIPAPTVPQPVLYPQLREATTAAGLVKAKWRELGLGKDLEKTARTSVRIGSGGVALRASYSEAWTRLFDKRFPWER